MLEYVNKKYNNHKLEQDLQGSVLKSNPVLRSMVKTPKLGTFVKYLLEEKLKYYQIKNDVTLIEIQTNILIVADPLRKLWGAEFKWRQGRAYYENVIRVGRIINNQVKSSIQQCVVKYLYKHYLLFKTSREKST